MKNIKLFHLVLITPIYLIIISCSPKKPTTTITKDNPKLNINLYVETSSSMAGYLNGKTEFKDVITGLASKFDDLRLDTTNFKIDLVNYFSIDDNKLKQRFANTSDFITSVLNSKIMSSGSSLLHNILKKGIDTLDNNTINVLVTDLTLSYGSSEVRKNPKVNIQNIDGLKNLIHNYFTEAKKKKFGFAIFSYNSKFKGTYYDYANKTHYIDEERPFYMFFYGSENLLQKLIPQLRKLGLNYENDFCSPTASTVDFRILQTRKLGSWFLSADRKNIEDAVINSKSSIKFLIALDLKSLPKSVDIAYLNRNLKIDGANLKVGNFKVYQSNEIKLELKDDIKHNLSLPTNYIELNVIEMYQKTGNVSFSLDYKVPDWVQSQSILDDSNPSSTGLKTFGLDEFIQGVYAAYNIDAKLIEFSIKLRQ